MTLYRIPIQSRELTTAIDQLPDGVIRRAAEVVAHVMAGHVVVVEEEITVIGDEIVIEETVFEAKDPE